MSLNLFDHPICLELPLRSLPSTWIKHTPFAMFLIDLLRPRLFVELGTFQGVSYCAFCQAVAQLNLDTKCFGIDTWEGDPHTGFYGQEILNDLRGHHAIRYGTFSNLIQSTFDNAKPGFEDGSIDLLHIDGYHTYEAVKHDFENWLPKVSDRGIVLMHDIHVHERDFGVWKIWEEIKPQYPTFEVEYGCGLGVIAVGRTIPEGIRPIFDSPDAELKKIREAFGILGRRVEEGGDIVYHLQNQINIKQSTIDQQKTYIDQQKTHIDLQKTHIDQQRAQNEALQAELNRVTVYIRHLEQSLGFRLVRKYQGMIERFLPKGTRLREMYDTARHLPVRTLKSLIGSSSAEPQRIPAQDAPPENISKNVSVSQPESPATNLPNTPLISVVIPVFNTPLQYLKAALKSVGNQTYKNWELCICDDGSSQNEITEYLNQLIDEMHERIQVTFSRKNEGISQATNKAVALARGEYIAFLDHDDELTPDALEEVAKILIRHPEIDIIYSDQDKIDSEQNLSEPFYKPDWSPEYFRHVMYVGHLLVIRRLIVEQAGRFDGKFNGVQDYEFVLRASEISKHIYHIPKILYHWRKIPGSIALDVGEKGEEIAKLQVRAVNEHLERIGLEATARMHPVHPHRVVIEPSPLENSPLVSIIILSDEYLPALERCINSIIRQSTYPNYEIIIVSNRDVQKTAFLSYQNNIIKVVSTKAGANISQKLNFGAQQASGSFIVTLSSQVVISSPSWVQLLLFYLNSPDVGAAGPLLLQPDGTVDQAGLVLGLRGVADQIMHGYKHDQDGYAGSLSCPREVSAVTTDCMMFCAEDFKQLGGFNEYYSKGYHDLDFCMQLRKMRKRVLYVPDAHFVKYGWEDENLDAALFLDRWNEWIEAGDPYYNQNFSREGGDYELK